MKKLLFILILSITIPSLTYAKCDGGVETKGKNGHDYCISDQKMNWWSAFAWCKANERHLVTLDEACNNKPWASSGCTNFSLGLPSEGGWTAIGVDDSKAYRLNFSIGNVAADPRTYGHSALCY